MFHDQFRQRNNYDLSNYLNNDQFKIAHVQKLYCVQGIKSFKWNFDDQHSLQCMIIKQYDQIIQPSHCVQIEYNIDKKTIVLLYGKVYQYKFNCSKSVIPVLNIDQDFIDSEWINVYDVNDVAVLRHECKNNNMNQMYKTILNHELNGCGVLLFLIVCKTF
jgi:hypothetical protein